LCEPYLPKNETDLEWGKKVVSLYQERLKKLSEITELAEFFFTDTLEYDKELLRWKDATDEQTKKMLEKAYSLLEGVGEPARHATSSDAGGWSREKLDRTIMSEAEKQSNRGYMLWPLRVALCGKKASPGPFEIAEVLGKEKTLQRIQQAIAMFEASLQTL